MQLKEAIEQKKVKVVWRGIDEKELASFTKNDQLKPKITMAIENNTTAPLVVDLDEGYLIAPTESQYQTQILAENLHMELKPSQKNKQHFIAYCTNLSKSSPSANTIFSLKEKAPAGLLNFVKWAKDQKLYNYDIQQGVWSFTDDLPIMSIGNSDAISEKIQRACAANRGLDYEKVKKESKAQNASQLLSQYNGKKIDRNLVFKNDSASLISAGYYDLNGNLLSPILDNKTLLAGAHSIRYNPYPVALYKKKYSVKLFKSGELYKEYYFMQ